MPDEVEITDQIDAERTKHNNLVAEFNERTAALVSGELIKVEAAERAMGERIGVARARLLTIPGGIARLLVGQDRDAIIQELRTPLAESVDALRPITADEVTTRDIVVIPDEHEDGD